MRARRRSVKGSNVTVEDVLVEESDESKPERDNVGGGQGQSA